MAAVKYVYLVKIGESLPGTEQNQGKRNVRVEIRTSNTKQEC